VRATSSPAPASSLAPSSELLRVATAGSVDDGKSTLIGRLLLETEQVFDDQLQHVEQVSLGRGDTYVNLALLTDGLRAEREQGITIDVAYRYFQTARRKFILADTPGHEQYTRNMVTGASTADVAVILVDARHGVVEQSRRHALITSLLRIPHAVVCVNKMDLVDFDESVFDRIVLDFQALPLEGAAFIPISALHGDNIVDVSERTPWYPGPPLLGWLESLHPAGDGGHEDVRLPVQWAPSPGRLTGQLASGALSPGDEVVVLPSGRATRVASIDVGGDELDEAVPPLSVAVRLEDELELARGDLVASADSPPPAARELEAMASWMSPHPLFPGAELLLKHTTRTVPARVEELVSRIDVNAIDERRGPDRLELNDLGRVRLTLDEPVFADAYQRSRATGSFILIDPASNETVGAGMIDA
jgi:sulfate adenylyltransferase large subunit